MGPNDRCGTQTYAPFKRLRDHENPDVDLPAAFAPGAAIIRAVQTRVGVPTHIFSKRRPVPFARRKAFGLRQRGGRQVSAVRHGYGWEEPATDHARSC